MSNVRICGTTCGYINSMIGGFMLVVQGILMMFSEISGASSLSVVGGVSFLAFTNLEWLNGLIMLILGIVVLLLVWPWLQMQTRNNTVITSKVVLGIILIVLGFVTGGTGGIFVLVGGILYIVGQTTRTTA